MLRPSDYHDLLSGDRRGLKAGGLRAMLQAASWGYRAGIWCHNARFDLGQRRVERVDVPIISVGNLSTGGTGKTPFVAWLAQWLRERALRVTLISRGYGAEEGASNDEALELEGKLPDVPHVQNPDRVAAARMAIEELGCQILLLDDAFQHRRIHRDLDIVLLDALVPFGYDHLLPRGTLREPVKNIRRADVVVLSRCDLIEPADRTRIKDHIQRIHPEAPWLEVAQVPLRLVNSESEMMPLAAFQKNRVAAFCGIGNPRGFQATLRQCDLDSHLWREFPDHHPYSAADIETLRAWLRGSDVAAVLCTMKDLVKIRVPDLAGVPLWAVEIGSEVRVGQPELESKLEPLVAQARECAPIESL